MTTNRIERRPDDRHADTGPERHRATGTAPDRGSRHRFRRTAVVAGALALVQLTAGSAVVGVAHAGTRTLVAADDFTGAWGQAPDPSIWTALQGGGGWGNHELQSYTARQSNVRLNGAGALEIVARKESYRGPDGITSAYTSARVITRQAVLYGYIEARIYLPSGQGLWPAFWTIGADVYQGVPWPVTGEIDVVEATNSMPSATGTIHGPKTGGGAYQSAVKVAPTTALAGAWHTYAIDWTSTAITWYLDGKAYGTITKASLPTADVWEFSKPQMLQLNLAIGGDAPGPPNAATMLPASMLVDYVRVYSN